MVLSLSLLFDSLVVFIAKVEIAIRIYLFVVTASTKVNGKPFTSEL
jgi:hypothetical protein